MKCLCHLNEYFITYGRRKEVIKKLDLKSPCNRECSRKRMIIMTKGLIQSYRMTDPRKQGLNFSLYISVFRIRLLYYNGYKIYTTTRNYKSGLKKLFSKFMYCFSFLFSMYQCSRHDGNSFKLNHSIFSLILMYNRVMKFCIKNRSMSIICEISAYNLSRLNWNW